MRRRISGSRALGHWRAAFVVLGLGVVGYGGCATLHHRREVAMAAAVHGARAALVDARTAGAATWAPAQLQQAERAFADAATAERVEAVSWWLPDATRVSAASGVAERAARDAALQATVQRQHAATTAETLVDAARIAVDASQSVAARIHLDAERRAHLARARTALTESRVYLDHGDTRSAATRAQDALDLTARVRQHAATVAARYADAATLQRWQRWIDETIDWSRRERRPAIIVFKEAHTLTLYVAGRAARTYNVELGFNWIADKVHAGDGATPEGRYHVAARKANGASVYHKALLIDYPSRDDLAEFRRARQQGLVPATSTAGGLIEIHGEGGRGRDWTKGCVALTNADIDDLFAKAAVGTPVTIVGSDNYGAIAALGSQPHGPTDAAR